MSWMNGLYMFIHEILCGGGEWGCVRQYVCEQYFSVHVCVCVYVCACVHASVCVVVVVCVQVLLGSVIWCASMCMYMCVCVCVVWWCCVDVRYGVVWSGGVCVCACMCVHMCVCARVCAWCIVSLVWCSVCLQRRMDTHLQPVKEAVPGCLLVGVQPFLAQDVHQNFPHHAQHAIAQRVRLQHNAKRQNVTACQTLCCEICILFSTNQWSSCCQRKCHKCYRQVGVPIKFALQNSATFSHALKTIFFSLKIQKDKPWWLLAHLRTYLMCGTCTPFTA